MDASEAPRLRQPPAYSERTEADVSLMNVAHGFLYVGDVDRAGIERAVCTAFRALRSEGLTPEAALAHVKAVTQSMMAGSLHPLDDRSYPWLRDSLVGWLIQCYY